MKFVCIFFVLKNAKYNRIINAMYFLARLIYQGWMYSNDVKEKWQQAAKDSNIQPLILMQLALIYWTHKKGATFLEIELKRFTQLLQAICLLAGNTFLRRS